MEETGLQKVLKATGSNAVWSGVVGGLVGGLIGVVFFVFIADSIVGATGNNRLAFLVAIVPVVVGFGIVAWPSLSAGQVSSALTTSRTAVVVALLAGIVGLLAATPVYNELSTEGGSTLAAIGFAFSIVSGLVGAGIGIAVSHRKAVLGLIGGLLGGIIGGLIIGAMGGGRSATAGQLVLAVPLAAAAVGAAIGSAERFAKQVWIDVLEGPLAGRELILYDERTVLGSADTLPVSLADETLEVEHVEVLVSPMSITVRSLSPSAQLTVNDQVVTNANVDSGDLIEIGRTFLNISRR